MTGLDPGPAAPESWHLPESEPEPGGAGLAFVGRRLVGDEQLPAWMHRLVAHIDGPSSTCMLVISDNGPGFSEQSRDRIFHPFFTTKPQGTGLGLALVQKIIVTHNGRVSAGSGPGGRMTVTLPALASLA